MVEQLLYANGFIWLLRTGWFERNKKASGFTLKAYTDVFM